MSKLLDRIVNAGIGLSRVNFARWEKDNLEPETLFAAHKGLGMSKEEFADAYLQASYSSGWATDNQIINMLQQGDGGGNLPDPVNHPSHYISESGLEVVEVIEAFAPDNPHRAHSIKYLCRAGRKGGAAKHAEDLKKRWWIERELDRLEKEGAA
jgi:Protein of unknwon function (DUF3310)